MKNFEETLYMM